MIDRPTLHRRQDRVSLPAGRNVVLHSHRPGTLPELIKVCASNRHSHVETLARTYGRTYVPAIAVQMHAVSLRSGHTSSSWQRCSSKTVSGRWTRTGVERPGAITTTSDAPGRCSPTSHRPGRGPSPKIRRTQCSCPGERSRGGACYMRPRIRA